MTRNRIAFLLAALASAAPAMAQPGLPEEMGLTVMAQPAIAGPSFSIGAVDLVAVEPFGKGPPVNGAPYSADAITEVTQQLADGNRIERRTSAKIARDGKGRIRREQQAMALGPIVAEAEGLIVTINDPVAGTFVTLDLDRKVAMRGKGGFFTAADRMDVIGGRVGGVPPPGFPPGAGTGEAPAVQTETLGSRDFDGVRADGQKTTTTIPAGAIGNQLPIEIVSERWFSPELQVVVYTRRSDPRFGETVYRLTNVVRAEPAAALFQIPADFRIEEPRMRMFTKPKPEGQ